MLHKEQMEYQKAADNPRMTEEKQPSEEQKEANIQRKMEESEKPEKEANDKREVKRECEDAEVDQASQPKGENCQYQNAGDGRSSIKI